MTWQGLRRKQLPPDWAARRKARLAIDGHRCTATMGRTLVEQDGMVHEETQNFYRCPDRATDVHHALDAHDHRIESLRSLCAYHHKAETQAEAMQARGVGPLRLRPKQKHPGLR